MLALRRSAMALSKPWKSPVIRRYSATALGVRSRFISRSVYAYNRNRHSYMTFEYPQLNFSMPSIQVDSYAIKIDVWFHCFTLGENDGFNRISHQKLRIVQRPMADFSSPPKLETMFEMF